jgi:hypothetical protein
MRLHVATVMQGNLPIGFNDEASAFEVSSGGGEFWIIVVKLLRAHGGCLGIRR